MKRKIEWSTSTKEGSIDGIPFSIIFKECDRWADEYVKRKFSYLIKEGPKERREIRELWKELSKEQKKVLNNTKGSYIT